MVSGYIVRTQVESASEFPLRSLPVPIVKALNRCERNVSLGEAFIELEGFHRCGPGPWESLRDRKVTVRPKHDIRVGHPGVSRSITGVQRDRSLEILKSFLLSLRRSLA